TLFPYTTLFRSIPQFRALVFWNPPVVFSAEGIHALFRTRFFFIATRSTEGCIKTIFVKRLLKPLGFHDIGVLGAAVNKWTDVHVHTFLIDVDDQIPPQLFHPLIA